MFYRPRNCFWQNKKRRCEQNFKEKRNRPSDVINAMYKNTTDRVQTNNEESTEFTIEIRLKQDCVLSP